MVFQVKYLFWPIEIAKIWNIVIYFFFIYIKHTLNSTYPLKRQEKMHLKNDVCWSRLLQIIA